MADTMTGGLIGEALRLARVGREQAEADLFEELRIPSISTDPERRADVRHNAEWLKGYLERLGFSVSLTDVEGGVHPVLQADWKTGREAPTVTIYGHYDVQPPDPLEEWTSDPFDPQVRDGLVFARGCSDNKGNHMAAIKAVEHLLSAGGAPVNIRFLIEGEEETSGPSLARYIEQNRERLTSDASLVWDDGFRPQGPALVTGLRGLLYTQVDAQGAAADAHSGVFGGVAPNPVNTLARIIGELKSREGRVTVPGFYDDILPPSPEELRDLPPAADEEAYLRGVLGVEELEIAEGLEVGVAIGMRPTLDANGFIGGFTGDGIKTVIPARASAKVSMRLVPGQDPDRIFEAFERHVQALTTPAVSVTVRKLASAEPVLLSADHRAARTAADAFKAAFGVPPILAREGGTIPVTIAFQRHIGGQIVCSGIIQPDNHAHSPDERLSLDNYHRGTEMLIHFLAAFGTPS